MTGVYAVIGGTDGVGTTTATAAIGASLAERTHRVAVIDGDGDDPSLDDAVGVTADGATVEAALRGRATLLDATYRASRNLDAVPRAGSDDGGGTRLGAAADLVAAARERYDAVLVDVGAGRNVETALWPALADRALFVSTLDDDSLAGVETGRHAVEYLGTPVEGVVLNRIANGADPDADAVAERVGAPVVAALPYDEAAVASSAVGAPVIDHDPDSRVAAGYWELASRLGDDDLADDPVVPGKPAERSADDAVSEPSEDATRDGGTDTGEGLTPDRTDDGFDWVAGDGAGSDASSADEPTGADASSSTAPSRADEEGDAPATEDEVAAEFKETMDRVREQRSAENAERRDRGERQGILNRLLD